MRVFNLTDVETPKLKQHKLLKQIIVVAGQSIDPGGWVDVKEPVAKHDRATTEHPLSVAAIALDKLPQYYLDGQAKASKPETKPAPAPAAAPAIAPEFPPPPVSKRSKAV